MITSAVKWRTTSLPDLCVFKFLHLLHRGEVVYGSVLNDWQENEEETGPQVNVHRFDIRHLRHGCWNTCYYCRHGQHSRDSCSNVAWVIKGQKRNTWHVKRKFQPELTLTYAFYVTAVKWNRKPSIYYVLCALCFFLRNRFQILMVLDLKMY